MLTGTIILSDNRRTTWEEVKRAILSKIPLEEIVEIRAFGSSVRELQKTIQKGSTHFFGMFQEPDVVKTIYPQDIDVLVLTLNKPSVGQMRVKVHAEYEKFGESCGYGFSYPASGYREDMLHVTMISKEYWEKAIAEGDPDAVRINESSVKF